MLIVADISGNHGGYLPKALELIQWAAECGCDYAKFQYYSPERMYASSEEDLELYHRLAVPHDWLTPMFDCAHANNIGLFASIFDTELLAHLIPYMPDVWKVASPQSTWLPEGVYRGILEGVPPTRKKDIVFSADARDIDRMQKIFPEGRALYCPPDHPSFVTDMDFEEFGDYWGFSDHTPDLQAPLAFAAAGAKMIEKHLKLDDNCVDADFSADVPTMRRLCQLLK